MGIDKKSDLFNNSYKSSRVVISNKVFISHIRKQIDNQISFALKDYYISLYT